MNTSKAAKPIIALLCAASLTACSGMTPRERDTAAGAAIGGAAGALITNSPLGTAAGAAIGGVIGHETSSGRR